MITPDWPVGVWFFLAGVVLVLLGNRAGAYHDCLFATHRRRMVDASVPTEEAARQYRNDTRLDAAIVVMMWGRIVAPLLIIAGLYLLFVH